MLPKNHETGQLENRPGSYGLSLCIYLASKRYVEIFGSMANDQTLGSYNLKEQILGSASLFPKKKAEHPFKESIMYPKCEM